MWNPLVFKDLIVVGRQQLVVEAGRFVHTGVFNGYGGNVRYAEHEIAFVRGEIALFAGIDAQDADGFAVHHQRGGQDGNEPFGLGALGVLEPAVATRIAQVDEFALEDFAVQPALGHFDGTIVQIQL